MGRDDVRSVASHDLIQLPDCPKILARRDISLEMWDFAQRDTARTRLRRKVTLPGPQTTVHKQSLKPWI
jgi:hypothetical protein